MGFWDKVPVVSNVKGAIEGDWAQAALGPAGDLARDAYNKYVNHLSGGKTDVSNLTQDRATARDLMEKFLSERGSDGYVPPQVGSHQVAAPQNVEAATAGPVQTVDHRVVGRPQDVQFNLGGTVERVQADTVAAPTVGPAAEASAAGAVAGRILDTGGQQVRASQMELVDTLKERLAGRGPSVAQAQFDRGMGQVMDAQMGVAAQARGTQRQGARLEAMRNIGDLQAKAAGEAALLRAQEHTQTLGQMGGLLDSIRGTDTNVALRDAELRTDVSKTNAGLETDTGQFNAGQKNDMTKFGVSTKVAVDTNNADRKLAGATTNAGAQNARDVQVAEGNLAAATGNTDRGVAIDTNNANRGVAVDTTNAGAVNDAAQKAADRSTSVAVGNADRNTTVATGNANRGQAADQSNQTASTTVRSQDIQKDQGLRGDALTASGQAITADSAAANVDAKNREAAAKARAAAGKSIADAGMKLATSLSDSRAKEDIRPESATDQDEFLQDLEAVVFRYKNPKDGQGVRHGILADDLLKSKIGRSLVHKGPDGLNRVDTDGLTLALAGIVARRLRERGGKKAA